MEKRILQWHPAFQAILQIEFGEEAQYLQFLKEYNLTEKPLADGHTNYQSSIWQENKKEDRLLFSGNTISWSIKAPRIISALTIFTR